jgi:thiamine kinase-like enzyme
VAGPAAIIAELERSLGRAGSAPVAVDGGITNRNFRVRFGERDCMLRLPGKDTGLLGISREAERLASQTAARLGIAPGVLAAGPDYLVTEFLPDAAPIDNQRLRSDPASAARALRAFHDSGLALPARFWVPDLLEDYQRIVRSRGHETSAQFAQAKALIQRIAIALPLEHPVPCHDDLLPANVLARATAPGDAILVDWEYAGMGHPIFDLGNLAVNNDFDQAAEERLLAAYYGEPPTPGRYAGLRLMRIMSDAREAAWGVVQGVISELDFDFAQYGRQHFERLARAARDPRLEGWLDGATA